MFPQVFGKYMLEEEIAAGGMARVYLATLRGADGFEKRLVVKQIRPELASDPGFVERFVKEAKTAVELSHPNIVPVYELGVEQGVYYIAMEHCDGVTLAEVLRKTGRLEPLEGAYLGAEVCKALDFAHRRAHIVHRDVTPRNVLIDEEGAVRLIDFGIAAPAAGVNAAPHGGMEVFGSPGHMPPEQRRGEPLNATADVYAVGVLLYEAWTGQAAYRRHSTAAMRKAEQQPLTRLSDIDPSLAQFDELLERAVASAPEERPEDAERMGQPLRASLRSSDATTIARKLGERVTQCRRQPDPHRASSAPSQPDEYTFTPAEGSGTQTFATRSDFAELVDRASSTPPPPRSRDRSASQSGSGSERTPVHLDRANDDSGPGTRKLFSEPPPAFSPESERSAKKPGAPADGLWQFRWLALVALATAVIAALLVGRGAERSPLPPAVSLGATNAFPSLARAPLPAPAPTRGAAGAVAPPAIASDLPSTSPASPSASAKAKANVAVRTAVPVSGAPPSSPPSSPPSAARGTLELTALPRASVAVGGQVFSTPKHGLSLPAGSYQVTFRNATWDGPVSTQVQLGAGQARRVHADFTTEPPKVVVR